MGGDGNQNPEVVEASRFEAQRHAFSTLLARFTADRDALIASIQKCEERLSALGARVDGGDATAAGGEGTSAAVLVPFEELKQLIEAVQMESRAALGQARAIGEHAMLRADEALRRIEEMEERGSATGGQNGAVQASVERLSRQVEDLQTGLTVLMQSGAAAGQSVEDSAFAQARQAEMAEELRALRTSVERLAGDVTRLEETVTTVPSVPGESPVPPDVLTQVESRLGQMEAALEALRQQIEKIERRRDASRGAKQPEGAVQELYGAMIGDLRDQIASLRDAALASPRIRHALLSVIVPAVAVAMVAVLSVR